MEPLGEPLGESPVSAYLGLGSNLGDRKEALARALYLLHDADDLQVIRCSTIYETEPWGYSDQPRFLNCVAEVTTASSPARLLETVKMIEKALGRTDGIRYGPRPIDIDILLYGDAIVDLKEPDLQIPHLRIMDRAFVLVPLAEIAGKVIHPVCRELISDLAEAVEGKAGVVPWGSPLAVYPATLPLC